MAAHGMSDGGSSPRVIPGGSGPGISDFPWPAGWTGA